MGKATKRRNEFEEALRGSLAKNEVMLDEAGDSWHAVRCDRLEEDMVTYLERETLGRYAIDFAGFAVDRFTEGQILVGIRILFEDESDLAMFCGMMACRQERITSSA